MEYKVYKNDTYNLYTIKTDKFKTCHLEIIFKKRIKNEEITINNFLGDYLNYTSKKYNKRKKVIEKLEDLYDASFYEASTRVGQMFFIDFILDFLDPKYTDKKYLEEVIKFPFEFIFNPNFSNGEANLKDFEVIKNLFRTSILNNKDNPTTYAFRQAFKTLDKDNPASFDYPGTIEDLDRITPEDLYNYYQEFLKDFACDIYFIGNTDMDKVASLVRENYHNNYLPHLEEEYFLKNKPVKKIIDKEEIGPYEQSSLIMLYQTDALTIREKNYVMGYFNSIFGNGSLSNKLCQYLREDNGMCYQTYSLFQKHDNLLIVYAGIDYENKDYCVKLVNKALKEMQQGLFTEEEIAATKNTLVNQIKSSMDTETSILDNCLFHNLTGAPLLNERLKEITTVTKEEIVALSKKIKLNTIYLLGGSNAKKTNN